MENATLEFRKLLDQERRVSSTLNDIINAAVGAIANHSDINAAVSKAHGILCRRNAAVDAARKDEPNEPQPPRF